MIYAGDKVRHAPDAVEFIAPCDQVGEYIWAVDETSERGVLASKCLVLKRVGAKARMARLTEVIALYPGRTCAAHARVHVKNPTRITDDVESIPATVKPPQPMPSTTLAKVAIGIATASALVSAGAQLLGNWP